MTALVRDRGGLPQAQVLRHARRGHAHHAEYSRMRCGCMPTACCLLDCLPAAPRRLHTQCLRSRTLLCAACAHGVRRTNERLLPHAFKHTRAPRTDCPAQAGGAQGRRHGVPRTVCQKLTLLCARPRARRQAGDSAGPRQARKGALEQSYRREHHGEKFTQRRLDVPWTPGGGASLLAT